MILNPKENVFAYRCPVCGAFAVSLVGSLSLTAEKIDLKCACEKSVAQLRYTKENKVQLIVPCFTCPRPHTFQTTRELFFSSDLLTFACPYSGLDICIVGRKKKVDEAIEDADDALSELFGQDEDFSVFEKVRGEDAEPQSPEALDTVMFTLNTLLAEDKIFCNCPDRHGDYWLDLLGDKVRITCKNCRAKKDIRCDSVIAAEFFADTDKIELE